MNNKDYTQLSVENTMDETVEVFVTFAAANSANDCCPTPSIPFLPLSSSTVYG